MTEKELSEEVRRGRLMNELVDKFHSVLTKKTELQAAIEGCRHIQDQLATYYYPDLADVPTLEQEIDRISSQQGLRIERLANV